MFRGELGRESFAPPEAVQQEPFFKPSSPFEHHLAPRNGKRSRIYEPIDSDSFPPGTPEATKRYWLLVRGEKKKEKKQPGPKLNQEPPRTLQGSTPDIIFLECGCTAKYFSRSRNLIPMHIKGCTRKEI